jgi:hypothetical protein
MMARASAKPRAMNRTEAEYELILKSRPSVLWCAYEAITLVLAHDTRYTPDFDAVLDGELVFFEVKGGFRRDDAMVKLRVAARLFPFRFILAEKKAGVWTEAEVKV